MADDNDGRYYGARRLCAALILQAFLDLKSPQHKAAARCWLEGETAATCLEFLDFAPSKLQGALHRYPDGVGRRQATRLAKVAALADEIGQVKRS